MSVRLTKEEAAALHRLATSRDFHPMDGGEVAASAVEKLKKYQPEPEPTPAPERRSSGLPPRSRTSAGVKK